MRKEIFTDGQRAAFDSAELVYLEALAGQAPTIEAAVARIAQLEARRTLPKGVVHVMSDVHGEHKKLRHVINNASGRLRPVVERVFEGELDEAAQRELLNIIYYPWEQLAALSPGLEAAQDKARFVKAVVERQVRLLRELASATPLTQVTETFPVAYREVMVELLVAPALGRPPAYIEAMVSAIIAQDKGFEFVRRLSRAIRNLAADEIMVAGDMGDRGPRIDKVLAYLMRQPNVSILWGNHDVLWMGACLGQEALIATTVRISLRYGRLTQLEEGYGVPMLPLQRLALKLYGDDPCARFQPKVKNLEDPMLIARMQKAIAVIQFKLEGPLLARHPDWGMADRRMMHRVDLASGTVRLGDERVPLADLHLPTFDPEAPYELSPDERACMDQLTASFLHSPIMWQQMSYMFRQGGLVAERDRHLIFHAAVPVGDDGQRQTMSVEGVEVGGRALFEACESVVHRAFRRRDQNAIDFLWYLWAGPVSPLFGKDKMATFESYFIADKAYAKETKNAYFRLLHDAEFVKGVLAEFGVDAEHGLVVNGHVPVKIEKGESPVKGGGNAVTIDGAFAAAYGDKGYTLVLEAERSYLAQHHAFDSVSAAISSGADIIPRVEELRTFERPRQVADTEAGARLKQEIKALERLIVAYQENLVPERG